jgi:hypothetical protein
MDDTELIPSKLVLWRIAVEIDLHILGRDELIEIYVRWPGASVDR